MTEDQNNIDRYTDYAYDRSGRLTRQTGYTDGTSGVQNTDYAYSKSGVKTLVTYPDSGTVSLAFDAVNRLTRRTDQRNVNIDFDYDTMGRVLTRHEGTNVYWTFGYNALGRPTSAKKGTSAGGEEIAKTVRLYNGLGQVTRESQDRRSESTKNVDYLHDLAGNVTATYYPAGDVTISRTVTGNRQTNVISRNGTAIADYDYVGSRVNKLIYETGANDVTADRVYDGIARMTRLTWSQTGNTLPDLGYAYDAAGNILTKTHEHRSGDPIEKYDIDGLYRLTDARYDFRTVTHQFDYDDLGNWLTYTENGAAETRYHNTVNEITKIGATDVLHDDAGNLTKDTSSYGYYYDAENRLTRVEEADTNTVASYEYDGLGRRVEFIDEVAAVTKRYYYDGERVIEEYDDAATPARQRYYVWGNYIDELLMFNDDAGDDSDYFVCHNHLYSPEALVDSTGSIVERYDYDAYGLPVIYTADGGDSDWWDGDETTASVSAKGLPYLFTGREFDNLDSDDLKLYYYRARTYHPTFGRFLQRDPIGYIDGMNVYLYARSNPLVGVDPTGAVCAELHPFVIYRNRLGVQKAWVQLHIRACTNDGCTLYATSATVDGAAGFGYQFTIGPRVTSRVRTQKPTDECVCEDNDNKIDCFTATAGWTLIFGFPTPWGPIVIDTYVGSLAGTICAS